MAITALPTTTVRLLNSAQVLTTPVSLVKELVDNALDAKATSVNIIISPNTLDKIEVRDNGHGIQPEDLDVLARHGHTSKLRSFEELKLIGGLTLGFRGEALASAVELGEVTVITKTEGESVGTMAKLKPAGGIDYRTRTSHPVGTTISVKNFMANLPVRKNVFEKEAAKTFAAITRLLQAYALARPSIRLNLKVSGGGKGSWSFIPHPNGDIREAILRTIGRDIAMQCVESIVPSQYESQATKTAPPPDTNPGSVIENFVVEAFLPNPDADPSKVIGGQYISVDSRPVSHEKGTMKKLVTMFKKYIQNLVRDIDGKIKSPFIRLNIRCPIASYDANIEPNKDEVLFENEDRLLDAVESLFKAVYGKYRTSAAVSAPSLYADVDNNIGSSLLSDTRREYYEHEPTPEITSPEDRSAEVHPISGDSASIVGKYTATNRTQSNMPSRSSFDMSEDLAIMIEGNDTRQGMYQHSRSMQARATKQIQLRQEHQHNPWTIAKQKNDGDISMLKAARLRTLPTESDPPQQPRTPSRYSRSESVAGLQLPINTEHDLSATDREQAFPLTKENDFITARSIVPESLISPPPTQLSKSSTNTKLLGPFRPPLLHTQDRTLSDGLHQTRIVPVRRLSTTRSDEPLGMSSNAELVWAMDFEKRKEEAMRRHRKELKASKSINTDPSTSKNFRSSPHKNRYNSAAASLTESQSVPHNISNEPNKMQFQTCLSHDDPRAYLMGRRRIMASEVSAVGGPPKMIRAKSAKLPLETVPREDQLQNLIQLLPVEHDLLPQAATILKRHDLPAGKFTGLPVELADIQVITQRLQTVVTAKIKDADGAEMEVEAMFDKVVFRSMN